MSPNSTIGGKVLLLQTGERGRNAWANMEAATPPRRQGTGSGDGSQAASRPKLGETSSLPFLLVKRDKARAFTSEEEYETDEDVMYEEKISEDEEDEDEDGDQVLGEDALQEPEDSSGDEDEDDEDDDDDSGSLSLSLSLSSASFMTRVRREEESYFSLLPAELRLNIFSFLCPSQLARIRLVSQQWRELAEDDRLWRRLHNERLGGPLVLKYSKNPIRKQVERNRRKADNLMKKKQKMRKKEWADKRKHWLRREKTKHTEQNGDDRAKEPQSTPRDEPAGSLNQESKRGPRPHGPTIIVSSEPTPLDSPPTSPADTPNRRADDNAIFAIKYAIREGVLNSDSEEVAFNGDFRSVKNKASEGKLRRVERVSKPTESKPSTGSSDHDAKWIEGYWAFGKYIKKLVHSAKQKENKEAQRKYDAAKKQAEFKLPPSFGLPASPPRVSPLANSSAVAGDNMRMRQFKALEEKEKRKEKREKRELKEKEKREKRARSLSDSRKEKEKKAANKIDLHGRMLKRERSRTTDDIVPAVMQAKMGIGKPQDSASKGDGPTNVIGRKRSNTMDNEDHLSQQRLAAREHQKEEKDKKATATLDKQKEKAWRREVDFWAFWSGVTRSIQAWILMTAASFGHRAFLERLYLKLKDMKTAGKVLVPIYHQLLHAACQQGQSETADLLLNMKYDFSSDRRISLSPAYKHMEHQLQVARWDAFRTASKWGHTKVVELLLSHGYQPDERALRGAIVGGQLDILKLLIGFGADIKPIHMKRAIYYRNRNIVAHLLELFPDLPRAEPYLLKIAVSTRANFRQTERVRNRTIPKYVDFDIVDLLLEHGADINDNSDIHYAPSPLHIAAQQGDPDLCEYLLERGADMHSIFSCPPYAVANPLLHKMRGLVLTLTPFEVAIYNGRERVVEFFLARASTSSHPLTELSKLFCKPEPKKLPKGLHLFRAAQNIQDEGSLPDNDTPTSPKERPRLTTVLHQPEELVQVPNIRNLFKIFRAFKVNFKEIESHVSAYLPALSPLHIAAKNDSYSGILALLMELGLNREKRDKKGRTPLLKAARFCATENIEVLLKYHASYDAIDCDGNSAFHHIINSIPSAPSAALGSSSPQSVPMAPRSPIKLRAALGQQAQSSPSSSSPSSSQSTSPSSSVAPSGSVDSVLSKVMGAVQLLMQAGADINSINNLDETCLDMLLRKSKKYCPFRNELATFLRSQGAKSGKDFVQSAKGKGKLRGLLGL